MILHRLEGNAVIHRTARHRFIYSKSKRSWLVAPSFSAGMRHPFCHPANLVIPEYAAAGVRLLFTAQVEGLQELVIQADSIRELSFTGGMV